MREFGSTRPDGVTVNRVPGEGGDDKCECGHEMVWHGEVGCEDCLCERFRWPVSDGGSET